jgi:hypothetical protein
VPRAVIEHFSRRRAEIVEHMAEHGGRSAKAAQVAALETRQSKDAQPADRLREMWRARAVEHGFDPRQIDPILNRSRTRDPAQFDERELTGQASTFGRPELIQAVAAAHPAGTRVADIEAIADAALRGEEIVPLKDGATERRYTTRDLLEAERALLETAERRLTSRAGVVLREDLERVLAGRGLSADQIAMVDGPVPPR